MAWTVDCSAVLAQSDRHQRSLPEKYNLRGRHLREFCATSSHSSNIPHDAQSISTETTTLNIDSHQLKEREEIKPIDFCHYIYDGVALYFRNLRHPSTIPGKSLWSRMYAMGMLPVLIGVLVFCQAGITIVLVFSTYTLIGKKLFQLFLNDQIFMFDKSDTVDPSGTEEGIRQLSDTRTRSKPQFSYYIANLLLILSTVSYERDDDLVKSAFRVMKDLETDEDKAKAEALLDSSEYEINAKAQLLGMRFVGVSELKSIGGPFAGLFYNDDCIVLVFKGTSVLAFNEFLIDGTIQRVDGSEYLYGEIHKGFYESLFPDAVPLDCYERATLDRSNPFQAVMESVFEIAKKLKEKSGKPVNLWMTGHSLGGALAALTLARLQLPLRTNDPLFKGCDPSSINLNNRDGSPRTVLQEMTARYNRNPSCSTITTSTSTSTINTSTTSTTTTTTTTVAASSSSSSTGLNGFLSRFHLRRQSSSSDDLKHESHHKIRDAIQNLFTHTEEQDAEQLVVIRDVYTYASPRLGDTPFAKEFDKHHTDYMEKSPYTPAYYRIMIDKDIVPMLPPSCNADMFSDDEERMFPCIMCPKKKNDASEQLHQPHNGVPNYGTLNDASAMEEGSSKIQTNMNSLLDYRHIGQMICLSNQTRPPIVKPSKYQTDYSADDLRTDLEAKELIESIEENLNLINNSNPESSSSASAFCANDILQEMEKAKARHDLDSLDRLRTPCTAEKFLLTFPNVMSHSPSAYQRNLMRTRYYYKSFPGSHLNRLIYNETTITETFGMGEREEDRAAKGSRIRDSGVVV